MKPLAEILPLDKTVACPGCGGLSFFDWGLKILNTAYEGVGPRLRGLADQCNIMICTSCHHPIANVGGDYYDAVEFISQQGIEDVIRSARSAERSHRVPAPVMDP